MARKCSICRQPGHDKRKCPENVIPDLAPNRGRGGGVRRRGRGRGSTPARQARVSFRPASQILQHIHEYDFNLDEIFDEAEYDPQPIITQQDELNFYQAIALHEHLLEPQGNYEDAINELYGDLEPGQILQELYPDVN
jgi:hypothetical protein